MRLISVNPLLVKNINADDRATRFSTIKRTSPFFPSWPGTMKTDVPSAGTAASQSQRSRQISLARNPVFTANSAISTR